jgi:ABC-2 type transport system permease protein
MTFGLPLFMLLMGALSIGATFMASGVLSGERHVIGIVDSSHLLDLSRAVREAAPDVTVVELPDLVTGQDAVRRRQLDALVVLDRDYVQTGRVAVYRRGGGLMSARNTLPIRPILARALLTRSGVPPAVVDRAVDPTGEGAQTYSLDRSGAFVRRSLGGDAAGFVVPYAFTLLLTMSIFFASSYLLRGIADEKESRVIEVILSSVSAEELLAGKLFGLGALGLTQVGIWLLFGAVPAMIRFSQAVRLSGLALATAVLFFVLGFALYAMVMAGLGALGTSQRESQQMAGIVSFGAFFPLMLLPVLIEYPNGGVARALSFIPFSAPTTMVLRVTAPGSDVPPADIVLSAGAIVLTIWLILKLCAKLFRFGLLIYGKRPGLRETVRYLREA